MSTIPLNDTTPRVQYTAAAGQTIFIYPFWVTSASDLNVYVEGDALIADVDFTVDGLLSPTGGNVTLMSATTEGQVVTIERNIPFERTSEFQEGGTFKASILNLELSKQLAMMQQLKRDIDRKIGPSPVSSVVAGTLTLPDPIDGRAIVFDGTDGSLRTSSIAVDSLDTAITVAQTSATSASNAATTATTAASTATTASTAAEAARDTALASIGMSKITPADTTPAPLDSKLAAGQLMFKSVSDAGGNEVLAMGVAVADEATAEAGTSNLVAMTPLRTKDAIGALSSVKKVDVSGMFTPSTGGVVTFNHTLGGVPNLVLVYAQCTSATGGYSVGDIVGLGHNGIAITASNSGHVVRLSDTVVELKFATTQIGHCFNFSTGAYFVMNASDWDYYIVAAL